MALVGQTIGREISKLERRHEKRNADKDGQRASSYRFVSSFGVISLQFGVGKRICEPRIKVCVETAAFISLELCGIVCGEIKTGRGKAWQ